MARHFRHFRELLFILALFAVLSLIAAKLNERTQTAFQGPFHVIDGDTLSVRGERLRLEGIDAPELDQSCERADGADWPCGQEARRFLIRLVAGNAECFGDRLDRYKRHLVRCRGGSRDINAAMVARGLAIASGDYLDEQADARRDRQGMWAGRFESPRDFRISRGMMEDAGLIQEVLDWITNLWAGAGD